MTQDINSNLEIIEETLRWASKFKKETFAGEEMKRHRRRLKKIRAALADNCSAAAYGESQVGKSYLMSSLLSSPDHPFTVSDGDKEYSFIDEVNPSGGNNAKIESTGVVTRFTVRPDATAARGRVRADLLSVVDIVLMIADSYYNDIKIDPATELRYDQINSALDTMTFLRGTGEAVQHAVTEDDIQDIADYLSEVVGNPASAVYHSKWAQAVAPAIESVPADHWVDIFSLLWNRNEEMNRLFVTLTGAARRLGWARTVYLPFDAVLRSKGTLLKIEWLDYVCGNVPDNGGTDELHTDVYAPDGAMLAASVSKGDLSALIAELTFVLDRDMVRERPFLERVDLLDFPGARSREKYREGEIATVLPKMLRRGKVAYLFNKYSRELRIGSVLFCHHNDQKAEATIGSAINSWINENIGATPADRSRMISGTNGISPLMMIATKFNIDLERTKTDNADDITTLDKHWNRFDTVIPEIIKPDRWLDSWTGTADGSNTIPFRHIYPLRDFYWSGKGRLFDGYSDGAVSTPELKAHEWEDYPEYMNLLRESFMRNAFVRDHFSDPAKTWSEFATLNNDGSKAIIRDLTAISQCLEQARDERYAAELRDIKKDMLAKLAVYYDPEDAEARNKKVRTVAGDIRRSLIDVVAHEPAAFGRIIDTLMVTSTRMRAVAYDILVCHTDTPRDYSAVNFYRAGAGVNPDMPRQYNVDLLCDYFSFYDEEELAAYLAERQLTVDDIVTQGDLTLSTMQDVIAHHLVNSWIEHLNDKARVLAQYLPHADEVVFMLVSLFDKQGLRKAMTGRIERYLAMFGITGQINAIADYAALTFNNFVSTVGNKYMTAGQIQAVEEKSRLCRVRVDLTPAGTGTELPRQSLEETLKVFDESGAIINRGAIDMSLLAKLPFWSNYRRWENLLVIGLLFSSDITRTDPECNAAVKKMLDALEPLYMNNLKN